MGVRAYRDTQGRRRYAVEFEVRGHRVFRRLPPGATKGQATELDARLRHELIDQAVVGRRPKVSVSHAINAWLSEVVTGRKSEAETRSKAGIVSRACGTRPFSQIAEARELVLDPGKAPATINRRLCVLKAVAKFGWRKGWSAENESGRIALIPGEAVRSRHISEAKIRALLAKAPDPETKAFIALAAYAGLRQGEAMALKPQDASGSRLVVRDTKTGGARVVPVVAPLRPFLKALPLTLHKRTLYARFEKARDAAGIPDLVYHDLRRSAATILFNSGADLTTVAHILGHASLATTRKVYAQVLDRTAKAAMDRAFRPSASPSGLRAVRGGKG